jgi:hypothetical protein
VASSPEGQALFVGNGGLDRVAALAAGRAATPGSGARGGGALGAAGSGGGGGAPMAVGRGVRLRCLGFIHLFYVHVLARAVRAGEALKTGSEQVAEGIGAGEMAPSWCAGGWQAGRRLCGPRALAVSKCFQSNTTHLMPLRSPLSAQAWFTPTHSGHRSSC